MTDEILDMMERRQKTLLRFGTNYRKLHNEIRIECKQDKKEWLNEKCAEIERFSTTNKSNMQKQIRQLIGQKTYSSTCCLKIQGWNTHIKEGKIFFNVGASILENSSTTKENKQQYTVLQTDLEF